LLHIDPITGEPSYDGFPQGRTWLASFTDNGPQDAEPTPGRFDFDISSLGLSLGALVTVAATYSTDPPGTHNGRGQTSVFSPPVSLLPAPRLSIALSGTSILLSWPTNVGLFDIQATPVLSPAAWTSLVPQPPVTETGLLYQAALPITSDRLFYRLSR
jgi:hypothetical protein